MPDRVIELINKLNKSDRDAVKSSVIEDLGNTGDPRALKPLIHALNDTEMLVRWNAIKALSKYGDVAVTKLREAVCTTDRFLRRNVVQALGELGGDNVVDLLVKMLMFDESDKMVQIEIVKSLDKIGDARAVDPVITVLKDTDWEMRYRAIHALNHLGDKRAVEPLLEVMNDPDKDIQWAAYMAIENLKELPLESAETDETATSKKKDNRKKPVDLLNLSAEPQDESVVVKVEGELLYGNVESFTGYVDGVVAVSKGDVIIDMSRCIFIDSFALSRLHALRKKLKNKNRGLFLSALKPNVMAVFSATKLDKVFDFIQ